MKPVLCLECSKPASLVTGKEIYPRRPDLADLFYWKCECGAYVGCHKEGTGKTPLGLPANADTRAARQAAHAAFDPLWERKVAKEGVSRSHARNKGYRWLAAQLGIDRKDCHISMMTAEMARRVVVICESWRATA